MIIKIILLAILIIINGIFAATEISFLSLNKYELHKKIKEGNNKAVKILNLINDSSTFLSGSYTRNSLVIMLKSISRL